MQTHREIVARLLLGAGITINGQEPWDIRVRDERLYPRILRQGSLGLGEAYMEGWWDCPRVDEFICRLLRERLPEKICWNFKTLLHHLSIRLFNLQSSLRAGIVCRKHYELGNELFFSFLDPFNQYSCALFTETDDLAQAQLKKLDLICRKIRLQSADSVLDIGSGWGGFARYAAETYGCTVTAVNICEEQIRYAREFCRDLPVEVLHRDYRRVGGSYDKIVSIGMFEHVGQKNYGTFMRTVHRCLKENGIFLLHTIGGNVSRINSDPWINRYIFPNGMLPSIAQIARAAERLFVIEDLHNLAPHYDKTLMAWNEGFQKAWCRIAGRYGEKFRRMWEYYLLSCAGAFRARSIQVWQFVMTRAGTAQPPCRFT